MSTLVKQNSIQFLFEIACICIALIVTSHYGIFEETIKHSQIFNTLWFKTGIFVIKSNVTTKVLTHISTYFSHGWHLAGAKVGKRKVTRGGWIVTCWLAPFLKMPSATRTNTKSTLIYFFFYWEASSYIAWPLATRRHEILLCVMMSQQCQEHRVWHLERSALVSNQNTLQALPNLHTTSHNFTLAKCRLVYVRKTRGVVSTSSTICAGAPSFKWCYTIQNFLGTEIMSCLLKT